jgi:nucleotide-binding universal stress UspA family protein
MKTILFPTDFSAESLHAAQYTALIAKSLGAKMVILHSFSIPFSNVSDYQLPFDSANYIKENEKLAEGNLKLFTLKLISNIHFQPENLTTRVEYGYIADTITETAKKIKADLIMMSTLGASGVFDKWLGSNTENVVENTEVPVWVIPENVSLTIPKTILYAAEFEDDEMKETKKLLSISKPLGAACKVVHIHETFELDINGAIKSKMKDLEAKFQDENITFKDLKRDDIVDGLETYIKNHKPDVLALALGEKTFFSKLFDTSVSKHFVLEAKWPILVFRK